MHMPDTYNSPPKIFEQYIHFTALGNKYQIAKYYTFNMLFIYFWLFINL